MNTTNPTNGQLAAADLRKAAEEIETNQALLDGDPPQFDEEHVDDDHPMWCVNAQIKGLLEGYGASEDHDMVAHFFTKLGFPKGTVERILKAIVCAEVVPVKPTPAEPTPSLKLGDGYDAALIGATITGHFAYSLTKLATIEADMRAISVEAAREIIAAQIVQVVREWGAGCPVFIDDSLVMSDSEASRIIVPGSAQFPGVEVGG